ncbi:hypothetical protein GNY06_00975 [Elizabethkingia argentiflava]|uniref:Type VI secretion system baseplate subunit TssF n=1 Tax=Elizabethkingia argenteiflava TaxID=2681556 RepID=A0A845PPH0_9FLAO|nr:type VI secretion system baseplate subunit TssF [Elizabethkingia argenteiflava]NAW50022.1 hypothetical protein [Elizabethkingia argenteiflava]
MNEKINVHSKESIKARMLQNAAKIWGLKNTSSIDPFVRLLIEAFSAELFRANIEVHSTEQRILERLAKILTPSVYTHPQPAHAIGTTLPLESIEILPANSEFVIERQFSSSSKTASDIQIDIPFTPVGNMVLTKMHVDVLWMGNTFFTLDRNYNKIPIALTNNNPLAYNRVKMGIDVSMYTNEELPDKLSFYCTNPTFEHIDFVFKLLAFVNIKNHDNELPVSSGLTYAGTLEVSGYEEIFNAQNIHTKIEENIKNIYKEKFIEVSGIKKAIIEEGIPDDLIPFTNNTAVKKHLSQKKYIWLDIDFPPQYSAEILENFSFLLNAFPVYNRGWRSNESSLDIMGNNIPLATNVGEHFLYVENVIDDHGNQYSEIPFSESAELRRGLYTVRSGGMERFTTRNAVDMISNLLELTRDEVAAFGILEKDEVSNVLTNMTTQMKLLEKKVNSIKQSEVHQLNYVIVDLIADVNNIKADYWVSHCELANNIRAGSELAMLKLSHSSVFRNLTLLTETLGGHEDQKGSNAVEAYKYALTTRDRLITIEDIKSYCQFVLRNPMKSVEVRRVTIISSKPKEGFIRAIEIEIIPDDYHYWGKKYWDHQAVALKHQIMSRGIDGVEYIVKIKKELNDE